MKSLMFFIASPYIFKKLGCGDWTALLQENSCNKYILGVNTPVYCINQKLQ